MKISVSKEAPWICVLAANLGCIVGGSAAAAEAVPASGLPAVVEDGRIGFVLIKRIWSIYQSKDGKEECPDGFNDGPREQYAKLFPDNGKPRTLLETQLLREGRQWFPTTEPETLMFKEAGGNTAPGMNLDGREKPGDFTSPDGVKGVDNQLFRVIGCVTNYRGPSITPIWHYEDEYVRRYVINRFMIEITDVDSLVNDDEVTVRSYRGLDDLFTDGSIANIFPGGAQRVDARWGKFIESTWKGRIVNGTLLTEGADVNVPASGSRVSSTSGFHVLRGLRFQLKLTPERAEGIMAGYVDVDAFIHHLNTTWSTHYQGYGLTSSPSVYRALRRLADGYPDPRTGAMTAISSSIDVKFVQAYLIHPKQPPDSGERLSRAAAASGR